MKKLTFAAVLLAGTALITLPAQADIITTDGFTANAATNTLTLVAVPPPGNQPQNNPCLICGTNQPGQPANFGFDNYKQGGNQTAFSVFSTSVTDQLDTDQLGTGYAASFLRAFLISQLDLNGVLNVGIDVNTATGAGPEVLERFAIVDLTSSKILADYNPATGTPLPTSNNGNGFPDYLLTGFNINRNDINAGDSIIFYARWSNASDGAESFFLVPQASAAPGPVVGAGIPGLVAACGGIFGLNFWRRRRQIG